MNPAHFAEQAELTELGAGGPGLPGCPPAELAALVEDPARPLPVRLAAGTALAVVGDPRTPPLPLFTAVPGGEVRIGLPPERVDEVVARWRHVGVERPWIEKEAPEFATAVRPFRLGTYPVTNGQYREFLAATGWPARPTTWYLGAYPWDRANHPVCGVAVEDAEAYAAWLAARTGLPVRLPTEAEWEHAAKGFAGTDFPWGDEFDPAAANVREAGVHTTSPVGAFPAGRSEFGLHDMAGNVEEYVADDYLPYPGGAEVADDLVETLGRYRLTRGGSFARYGDLARTRRRHGAYPGPLYPAGFRVAADAARPAPC